MDHQRSVSLTLSDEERALLADLLDSDYRDLKQEIANTEGFEFKEELKAREAMLLGILERVTGRPVGS
jgi:hypothetical protein